MVGIPLAIAGIGAALYFATREGQPPFPPECNDGDEMLEQCWDGSYVVTHTCQNGQWVPTGLACPGQPPPPVCNVGETIQQMCWDGNPIITHQCVNGQWHPTGLTCPDQPPPPPPVCNEGEAHRFICPDGTKIVLKQCIGNQWVPGNQPCPGYPPFPPAPPEPCSAGGGPPYYCCYDYREGQKGLACKHGGQWFPMHGLSCEGNQPSICKHGTTDYIHLYYNYTFQGDLKLQYRFYDHIDNAIRSTQGFVGNQSQLMTSLDWRYNAGELNLTQYNNAIAQAQYMGFIQ